MFLVSFIFVFIPPLPEGGGVYSFTSVRLSFRPSNIFFVAFFSVTVDGRNLIFGHKLHRGMPYCGKRFWTHQIPTSCLPTQFFFFIYFISLIYNRLFCQPRASIFISFYIYTNIFLCITHAVLTHHLSATFIITSLNTCLTINFRCCL